MDRTERERQYASLAAAWSPQTIAKMLCDLEDTYAVVVNERDAARAEATRYREWIREWQDQDPYPWAEDSDRCHYCGHKGRANRSHYPECAWQQARDLLAATEPEEP